VEVEREAVTAAAPRSVVDEEVEVGDPTGDRLAGPGLQHRAGELAAGHAAGGDPGVAVEVEQLGFAHDHPGPFGVDDQVVPAELAVGQDVDQGGGPGVHHEVVAPVLDAVDPHHREPGE